MINKNSVMQCGPNMIDLDDPIIARLHKHINTIADMCNDHIRPWEPNAVPRAVRLCNELAKPYIDALCDYMATRTKFAFPVAWCNRVEGLVPVGDSEDFLY